MRNYLIIGAGRAARHMKRYFELTNTPHFVWQRKSKENLKDIYSRFDFRLILIKDNQIRPFLEMHPFLKNKRSVHFSGALVVEDVSAAHPLISFSEKNYTLEEYQEIPFVTEQSNTSFTEIFPHLNNPAYAINQEQKSLYHALCVLAGNFPVLLWESILQIFTNELKLPANILHPYIQQVAKNVAQSAPAQSALTGPIARKDIQTIICNLEALQNRPEKDTYYAFLNYAIAKGLNLGGGSPNDHLAI